MRLSCPNIAARAFNAPLLVEPSKAAAFLSGLGPRIFGRPVEMAGAEGAETIDLPPMRASVLIGDLVEAGDRPYAVTDDGIAVIQISGVLIHRGSWIGESSGQMSYEGIAAQIAAAARDPAVRAVALEIDSFGGEVAGVFDLADQIRDLRARKPVWAFVAEHAYSAAYALASQADRIVLPRTGGVGSIGVVVMHTDLSGQLDQDGVRVTLIHAGQHKIDGNPYAPLPEAVRDRIQQDVEAVRDLFAQIVAAGRGARLSAKAALATEAETYRGTQAVAAGLADEVTDLMGAFAAFRQSIRAPIPLAPDARASTAKSRQEMKMTDQTDIEPGQADIDSESVSPAAVATDTPSVAVDTSPVAQATSLAEIPAPLREAAAEIAQIAAQAARLGVAIDTASALRDGTAPDALRAHVLDKASAAADARDIIAAAPAPARASESPIVAAAKKSAAAK